MHITLSSQSYPDRFTGTLRDDVGIQFDLDLEPYIFYLFTLDSIVSYKGEPLDIRLSITDGYCYDSDFSTTNDEVLTELKFSTSSADTYTLRVTETHGVPGDVIVHLETTHPAQKRAHIRPHGE